MLLGVLSGHACLQSAPAFAGPVARLGTTSKPRAPAVRRLCRLGPRAAGCRRAGCAAIGLSEFAPALFPIFAGRRRCRRGPGSTELAGRAGSPFDRACLPDAIAAPRRPGADSGLSTIPLAPARAARIAAFGLR